MNTLSTWIQSLFTPEKIQEISLEDLKNSLGRPEVQTLWFMRMIEKLQAINRELDNLLAKEDKDRIWQTLAIERRTLLRCLNLIVESEQEIESARFDQTRQDRLFTLYQGAAAPLDIRRQPGDWPPEGEVHHASS